MAVVEKSAPHEKVIHGLNIFLLCVLTVMFLYPMWHCLMASFSEPTKLIGLRGMLYKPVGPVTLIGYQTVLRNNNIYTGYGNTLFYVVVGTALNMIMTIIGAYCLSRRGSMWLRPFTLIIVVTMYIGLGLIPSFLTIKEYGLYNSRWALILPGAVSTYSMIVMRTAIHAVPRSLEESAMIDGANDLTVLFRIIVPCTTATIAVIALGYVVGHWNAWFGASIYLQDRKKWPLQLFLREILIANSQSAASGDDASMDGLLYLDELIKYCTIIISTVPILCVYPFVQKYFVTGMMLGSVKE